MKKVVAVIGNGYVGKGMAAMFSGRYDVVRYDPAQLEYADKQNVMGADLAVVCVPTPQAQDGRCDTSAVEEVLGWCDAKLVCIKSTVPPGFTDLNNGMDANKHGAQDRIHFSPEYMGEPLNYVPGHLYPDPHQPVRHDFCIVGGPRASEVLDYFAAVMATSARFEACTALEAELCKYMENTFFALKTTFCAEWAEIARVHGVDYKVLRELWLLDSRMGRDHTMVFSDNPGFGGKCLPKDLSAIVLASVDQGYEPRLLRAVQDANFRIRHQVEK